MNASKRPHGILVPMSAPLARRAAKGNVLAIVGGVLDAAVIDLAQVLARDATGRVDLLLLVEVPIAFPMRAYGEMLMAQGGDAALAAAEQTCGTAAGEVGMLLCRGIGPALVAEVRARGCADLVMSAPAGGWWARWRGRRAIAHVQARAGCRVYVVHVPPPAAEEQLLRRAAR